MRLVACPDCHAQFDVSTTVAREFSCHCGATVDTRPRNAVDAEVHRCGSCGALLAPRSESCGFCKSAVIRDRNQLSLVCPECYARNAEVSRFCTGCGVEFKPRPVVLDAGPPLPCPACEKTLAVRGIGGIRVQECPNCNGLWVPGDNFNELIERAVEAQNTGSGLLAQRGRRLAVFQTKVVYRKCPRCGHGMQRKNFAGRSGVIVDWCGAHGTWLDADELESIASFITAGGLEAASADPALNRPWNQAGDADRMRALYESEKLLAQERTRSTRRQKVVNLEFDGEDVVDTIGKLLSRLLG